jgi:glutamate--cysteine ligase
MSYRGHVWTRVDPRRTGFPPGVRDGYTHAGWVNYLLDCPMMFYMRDGQWAHAEGRCFRDWMENGIDGVYPSESDWALHQTSVFPEVRVKRTIEIRSADAVPIDLAIAFCALWTGLLYGALDEARAFARHYARAGGDVPVEFRFAAASRNGLEGTYGDRSYAAWAAELSAIARRGLVARGEDRSLLDPLDALVATGRSPAARLLDAWNTGGGVPGVLAAAAY